jgi:hydrogenase maturation protein HypF
MPATLNIKVYGIVQGVGFRPFVSRIADKHGVLGSVCNKGPYVEIIARGEAPQLDAFRHELEFNPPERAAILKIDVHTGDENAAYTRFDIIESAKERGDIFVSPDIAICDKCKAELFDKNNRRYLHPFINCTACGPRLTILDSMPYDRVRTSMGEFPMCPTCEYEYTHAETRRYDAQPVCCNDCGPEVYLLGSGERGPAALTKTRQIIAGGGIVAIKGIGGFHLCCDATSEAAVARLRKLKHRPVKPFAVMLKDMEAARRECRVEPGQAAILDGHQKPIILLKRKAGSKLCDAVAPGNPKVGVMLPYAPVQLLIFTYPDGVQMPEALVMTSGNPSGAPICRDDEGAVAALSSMCDAILSHNRKIRLRADDSVMDFFEGKPYMIRRSRGYAPLPFMLANNFKGQVLAVGGELKNTFCLGSNNLFYPSPYIGDMSDLRTVRALEESITRMETLLENKPELIACDLHPRYNTTQVAQDLGKTKGLPVLQIQHHYAHIVSCMAENDYPEPVIGVSFDGTGYGTDGTVWGGEFFKADYRGFTRLGSIKPFTQAGGDISAVEGWRIAVSMLYSLTDKKKAPASNLIQHLELCDVKNILAQFFMLDHQVNCVTSTSAGRLYDAVSAILGIRKSSTFEGEASMYLEFAAEAYEEACTVNTTPAAEAKEAKLLRSSTATAANSAAKTASSITKTASSSVPLLQDDIYPATGLDPRELLPLTGGPEGRFCLPTDKLVWQLTAKKLQGLEAGQLAYAFHVVLADQIIQGCREAQKRTGLGTVALSGGVFQNQLLVRLCAERLRALNFKVLLHSLVPPNDGGIALGQAVAAMQKLQDQKNT